MAKYLFIESRDPYESADCAHFAELVQGSRARDNSITLFPSRTACLPHALADAFSLRERAVDKLANGIKSADVDRLVSLLLEPGTKALWH